MFKISFAVVAILISVKCSKSQEQLSEYKNYSDVPVSLRYDSLTTDGYDKDGGKLLIFEKHFNDSILVLCDNEIVYYQKIRTLPSIEAVYETFYWSKCKDELIVALPDKKQKLIIKLSKNYQFIYVNRNLQGKWFVAHSNELRKYK